MEGNGMREKVGCCSEDTASVHGSHALPTELLGRPRGAFLLIRRSIDLMSTSAPRQFSRRGGLTCAGRRVWSSLA